MGNDRAAGAYGAKTFSADGDESNTAEAQAVAGKMNGYSAAGEYEDTRIRGPEWIRGMSALGGATGFDDVSGSSDMGGVDYRRESGDADRYSTMDAVAARERSSRQRWTTSSWMTSSRRSGRVPGASITP